jgi:hypothetical protein
MRTDELFSRGDIPIRHFTFHMICGFKALMLALAFIARIQAIDKQLTRLDKPTRPIDPPITAIMPRPLRVAYEDESLYETDGNDVYQVVRSDIKEIIRETLDNVLQYIETFVQTIDPRSPDDPIRHDYISLGGKQINLSIYDADVLISLGRMRDDDRRTRVAARAEYPRFDKKHSHPERGTMWINIVYVPPDAQNWNSEPNDWFQELYRGVMRLLVFDADLYDHWVNSTTKEPYESPPKTVALVQNKNISILTGPTLPAWGTLRFGSTEKVESSPVGLILDTHGYPTGDLYLAGRSIQSPCGHCTLAELTALALNDTGWYVVDFETFSLSRSRLGPAFGRELRANSRAFRFEQGCGRRQFACSWDYAGYVPCQQSRPSPESAGGDFYARVCREDIWGFSSEWAESSDVRFLRASNTSSCLQYYEGWHYEEEITECGCFETSCTPDGQLKFVFEGKEYFCRRKGHEVSIGDDYHVICPDVGDRCYYEEWMRGEHVELGVFDSPINRSGVHMNTRGRRNDKSPDL